MVYPPHEPWWHCWSGRVQWPATPAMSLGVRILDEAEHSAWARNAICPRYKALAWLYSPLGAVVEVARWSVDHWCCLELATSGAQETPSGWTILECCEELYLETLAATDERWSDFAEMLACSPDGLQHILDLFIIPTRYGRFPYHVDLAHLDMAQDIARAVAARQLTQQLLLSEGGAA